MDPTEPPRSGSYPHAPKPIEPFLEELRGALQRCGTQPFDLPLSWSESAADPTGDAELFGVDPARAAAAVQVRERARVRRQGIESVATRLRRARKSSRPTSAALLVPG